MNLLVSSDTRRVNYQDRKPRPNGRGFFLSVLSSARGPTNFLATDSSFKESLPLVPLADEFLVCLQRLSGLCGLYEALRNHLHAKNHHLGCPSRA